MRRGRLAKGRDEQDVGCAVAFTSRRIRQLPRPHRPLGGPYCWCWTATRWLPSHAVSSLVLHTRSAGRPAADGPTSPCPEEPGAGWLDCAYAPVVASAKLQAEAKEVFFKNVVSLWFLSFDNDIKDRGVPIDIATRPIVTSACAGDRERASSLCGARETLHPAGRS